MLFRNVKRFTNYCFTNAFLLNNPLRKKEIYVQRKYAINELLYIGQLLVNHLSYVVRARRTFLIVFLLIQVIIWIKEIVYNYVTWYCITGSTICK